MSTAKQSKLHEMFPKKLETTNGKLQNRNCFKYLLMIGLAIGIKSWQPLAIASSKQPDGTYTYNKTVMVILVELMKLIFCGAMLVFQYTSTEPLKRPELVSLPFKQSLHFLVPAVLYGASNTLVYYGISFINPALFHVLGNIRIMTAGLLYRFIMKKKLSDLQWMALMLLTIGAVLATPELTSAEIGSSGSLIGLLVIFVMCTCSTSSSIYTELNYKKTQELSIFYQNMVLYSYGILVNSIFLVFTLDEELIENGLFYGFDGSALHVLIAQTSMGVSLSFVFKFLDNIVYVICLTVAMLLTAIMSALFFDFEFTLPFICALVLVTSSIYLYYRARIIERFEIDEKTFFF